jgi:undecaprenyl pyrophosphate synthase
MEKVRKYIVYFEIFGKKMKTEIMAGSGTMAQEFVKDKIKFHKTVLKPMDEDTKKVSEAYDQIVDVFKKAGINL